MKDKKRTDKQKQDQYAKTYINSYLQMAFHDCSDSSEEADLAVAQFNAIIDEFPDDSRPIQKYIKKNLKDYYDKAVKKVQKEAGGDEPSVMDLF